MSNKTDNAPLTQGPWFVWNDGVYAGTPTQKTSGRLVGHTNQICTVDADVSEISEDEADAVLFLIAAAPQLLKELRDTRDHLQIGLDGLIASHTNTATGLIDSFGVMAIEAEQDRINAIDRVLATAIGMHSTEEGATA